MQLLTATAVQNKNKGNHKDYILGLNIPYIQSLYSDKEKRKLFVFTDVGQNLHRYHYE